MAWLAEHGFTLLQSVGIIGGLFFTGIELHLDRRARRVENRMKITEAHREIWSNFTANPALGRILEDDLNLDQNPVTEAEFLFVTSAILHLNAAFDAYDSGLAPSPGGLQEDIRQFFSKPIPRHVWHCSKHRRDRRFREFVETAIE